MVRLPPDLSDRLSSAVAHFWRTRRRQQSRQEQSGRTDQGARGAVTGGAQMDGFIELLTDLIVDAGIDKSSIYYRKRVDLPGFFRATKEWDLVVVHNGQLLVAVEAKSQVGSFGNNFNNRTEEAMGSALDIWTAYREGAFVSSAQPWLGYIFLLQDCDKSRSPVRVREPHFKVFEEFRDASYAGRYEIFCRKLVRERQYTAAAFLTSHAESGQKGEYEEPASDLAFEAFARSLVAHVSAHAGG